MLKLILSLIAIVVVFLAYIVGTKQNTLTTHTETPASKKNTNILKQTQAPVKHKNKIPPKPTIEHKVSKIQNKDAHIPLPEEETSSNINSDNELYEPGIENDINLVKEANIHAIEFSKNMSQEEKDIMLQDAKRILEEENQ